MNNPFAYAIALRIDTPPEVLRLLQPCLFLRRDDPYILSTSLEYHEAGFLTLSLRHVDEGNPRLLQVFLAPEFVLAVEVLESESDVQRIGFHS
jgi:hypothetical protein